ncbi:MAG: hypothetical protein V3T30_02805, partial [Thermodesulfobacteriota bacterium]
VSYKETMRAKKAYVPGEEVRKAPAAATKSYVPGEEARRAKAAPSPVEYDNITVLGLPTGKKSKSKKAMGK